MVRVKEHACRLKAFICATLGVAIVAVAIILAVQRANAHRWDNLESYNSGVSQWTRESYPRPFNMGFSGGVDRVSVSTATGPRLTLIDSLRHEFSYRDAAGGRDAHTPSYYIIYLSRSAVASFDYKLVVSHASSGGLLANVTLDLGRAEATRAVLSSACSTPGDASACDTECSRRSPTGAVFDTASGRCKHTYALVDVCATVEVRGGTPRLRPCYSSAPIDWGGPSPVSNATCGATQGCGEEGMFFYDPVPKHAFVAVTLRSSHDPYVLASSLTGGCSSCTIMGGRGPAAECPDADCFGEVPLALWVDIVVGLCGVLLIAMAVNACMVASGAACYQGLSEHEVKYGDMRRQGRKSRNSDVDLAVTGVTPGLIAKMQLSPKGNKAKKKAGRRVHPVLGSTGSSMTPTLESATLRLGDY